MPDQDRERLQAIRTFPSLVKYLRDELDWPIETEHFDDLTFEWEPEELGLDLKTSAKIQYIKQLRPLTSDQPWGIFFAMFEPKRLPVVALRRILSSLAIKKRQSAAQAERPAWQKDDLLFISAYGEHEQRHITFAHFSESPGTGDLPVLRVLGWDGSDTPLHIDHVHTTLTAKLRWPGDASDLESWRKSWSSAFRLRPREVITTSRQLAIRLAELARDIRQRVNSVLAEETEHGPMRRLMKAFKEALIHDIDEDDFADMYAQTVAYGLLSARISHYSPDEGGSAALVADDVAELVPVTNPFLKELMATFLSVGGRRALIDFDELGVNDVVETLRDANMEAVLRDFGDKAQTDDPVFYFYEDFIHEYDPQKRKRRGIYFTPLPVVSFIVRSVDEILRTEFGLEDGLADTTTWREMAKKHKGLKIPDGVSADEPFVQILDPACGTGTFLVEVIDLIHKTMVRKWEAQGHTRMFDIPKLWNDYVARHLLARLYGFELMMAPYAVAHMKVGLKLHETRYNFRSHERARIYLTNTLEEAKDFADRFEFDAPALAHEATAVNVVKRSGVFTVVLGNPPYSVASQNRGNHARLLIAPYKEGLDERKINLDDDFVKFIRYAEHSLERVPRGVLGYITNSTYLDGITHRRMREHLLGTFTRIAITDLHGAVAKREMSPDGSPDQNVFDIEQGVAITIAARGLPELTSSVSPLVRCDIWGTRDAKYSRLLSPTADNGLVWSQFAPRPPLFLFHRTETLSEWPKFWSLGQIMYNKSGFMTQRDDFVVDCNPQALRARVASYFRSPLAGKELTDHFGIHDFRNFSVERFRHDHRFHEDAIQKCLFRPFDWRFVYFEKTIVQQQQADILRHLLRPNVGLIIMRQVVQGKGGYSHVLVTSCIADHRTMRSNRGYANVAPLYLYQGAETRGLVSTREPNFSAPFIRAFTEAAGLEWIGGGRGDLEQTVGAEDVLHVIYAILHSSRYRTRYLGELKRDFPRVPLCQSRELLAALSQFGADLVALHLLAGDYVGASWNAGPRECDDPFTPPPYGLRGTGMAVIAAGHPKYKGGSVWISPTRWFEGVPEVVWNFHIGGYQVCEKWLKDRQAKGGKNPRPGRVLTDEDIDHYQKIVVALSETIRIMAEIDEVIESHGGWPDAFVTGTPD